MALKEGYKVNFQTLIDAAKAGDLCLLECIEIATGELRAVLCAVNRDANGNVEMVPFGHLCPGNPFDTYQPPV